MGYMEERLLNEKNKNRQGVPKMYLRYIDDIYAVFENSSEAMQFLETLNSFHKNIKFTIEKATEKISFLDVQIDLNETGYNTSVWRKPTNTGFLLNFNAKCPKIWKSSLIMCFLHRAKFICSKEVLFKNEVNNICNIFLKNGYPQWFIINTINKYEERIQIQNVFVFFLHINCVQIQICIQIQIQKKLFRSKTW